MDSAISMYRGGDIVHASDCDYDSSRELGLLCPFCRSAVFWKRDHFRADRVIDACFSHYKTGIPEDYDCELRSHSKQGEEQIKRAKVEAKNQRLKLFNARLWDMIKEDRNVTNQVLRKVADHYGQALFDHLVLHTRRDLRADVVGHQKFCDSVVDDFFAAVLDDSSTESLVSETLHLSRSSAKEEIDILRAYITTHNMTYHKAIAQEVIKFLSTRSGGYALEKILKCLGMIGDKKFLDIKKTLSIEVAAFVSGVHWARIVPKYLANFHE